MDSITTPDERGGLWPHDYVSFVVVPAKKGVQAIDVTLEEEPQPTSEQEEEQRLKIQMGNVYTGNGGEENGAAAASGKENAAPVADEGGWDLSTWGA